MKKKVIIFVSGNGSNMENIISFFKADDEIKVSKVLTNKPKCNAIEKALQYDIPVTIFNKTHLINGYVLNMLLNDKPDLIVLAGFLLKLPEKITQKFNNKIVNIHPSLLPSYGGKGMYGMYVHQAVIHNKEKKSGITIHYVNENYDEGAIIEQHDCEIDSNDTLEVLTKKIHTLEMEYFPKAIKSILS